MKNIVALRTNRDYYDVREAAEYSLTVDELIDILSNYSGDAKVVFSNDNGYTYGVVSDNIVKSVRVRMNESFEDSEEKWDDNKNVNYIFQLSRMVMFNVSYRRLMGNKQPYFATSAQVFCKNKKDIARGGQCQSDVLKDFPLAYEFWKKWDGEHLHRLNIAKYEELLRDIEELKEEYNWDYTKSDSFPWYREVELSKQKPKRRITPRR